MKYIFLIGMALSLSGCGATGSAVGGIVSLPVKIVKGTAKAVMNYDDDGLNSDTPHDIDQQAMPINTQ